jgi:hypothetical protein
MLPGYEIRLRNIDKMLRYDADPAGLLVSASLKPGQRYSYKIKKEKERREEGKDKKGRNCVLETS